MELCEVIRSEICAHKGDSDGNSAVTMAVHRKKWKKEYELEKSGKICKNFIKTKGLYEKISENSLSIFH